MSPELVNELVGFIAFYGVLAALALGATTVAARAEDPDWQPHGRAFVRGAIVTLPFAAFAWFVLA